MPPDKRPPPQPNRPPILDQQPERSAVRLPRDEPPARSITLPGYSTAASGEFAPTVPAPTQAQPPKFNSKQTMRVPTPPSSAALAKRSEPPTSADTVLSEEPPVSLPEGQEAVLRQALARERQKVAELERQARVRLESLGPGPYQPPIRSVPIPVASSVTLSSRAPTEGDWAKLRFKAATAVVGALVIVIAALAYWGAAAINAKAEAIKAAQETKTKAENRDAQWRQWASVVTWIQDCRNGQQLDVNEMLLPAPDKMGSARKPEPWIVKCPKLLPPPP